MVRITKETILVCKSTKIRSNEISLLLFELSVVAPISLNYQRHLFVQFLDDFHLIAGLLIILVVYWLVMKVPLRCKEHCTKWTSFIV